MLPPADGVGGSGALAALGIISAALYATGLALGAESLARTSFWLLYAEEDRYRLLARNMTDVITRHGRNGAVLFVSPAAETLFGAKVQRAARPSACSTACMSPTVRPISRRSPMPRRWARPLGRIPRAARSPITTRAAQPASQFIWVEMRCRRSIAPAARPASREVVAVMRDVTERKEQEQALEEARAEAERANAAKGRFLATMSHELRTPLNAIIGFSEMLTNEERMRLDAARRHEYAQLINDSGTHLLSVVNGILDMSKIETGNFEITPEPFAPAQVIGNCCDLLALQGARGRHRSDDAAAGRPAGHHRRQARVQADPAQPDVQRDQVHRSRRPGHGQRAESKRPIVVIAVEDTGVGIGADDLPRIGEPFFQARGAYDRRHDGTGLGLSIVKGLVALHGGELDIAAGSARARASRCACRSIARPRVRRSKPSNVAHPSFDRVVEAAEALIKKTA